LDEAWPRITLDPTFHAPAVEVEVGSRQVLGHAATDQEWQQALAALACKVPK
jgi:hypothetical protein